MPDYSITIRMRGQDELSGPVRTVTSGLDDLGSKADQAKTKSGGLKTALGEFKTELLGMATAFGLIQVAQFIGDMNELGMEVNAARNTFTELSGGSEAAAANLKLMQESTRNVVSDLDLMKGANRLLLMGLAETGEEASSLAAGATALGKAMGMEAGQAFEDFAALLSNQSIPRLDNFGISSANVKQRIEELKAAGYGMEEAFNMAVIAEMEVSLERLGPSLDQNATAVERWGVRIQNAAQDAGSGVAGVIEDIALAAEVATGQDAESLYLRELAAKQASAYVDGFVASYGDNLKGSEAEMQAFLEAALYARSRGQASDAVALSPMGIGTDLFAGLVPTQEELDRLDAVLTGMYTLQDTWGSMQGARQTAEAQAAAVDFATTSWRNFQTTLSGVEAVAGTAFNTLIGMGQKWQTGQTALAASAGTISSAFAAMGLDPAQFAGKMFDFQMPTMPEFVSQDTMTQMTSMYQQAQVELQNIQSLAAQGLIPQSEVTKAQNMVSNLGTMVGQLQTIQQLSDITGQTGGGILGELGNIVMAQAGEGGMGEDLIAQLQREINLASGAETASSVALQEQAAPLILAIAEQIGPQAAAAALQSLNENMQNATLAGLSQEEIAAMIPQMTGYTMGEGGLVSQLPNILATAMGGPMLDAGDTTGAGGAPVSMSGEMQALQENLPIVAGLMTPVADSSAAIATDFAAMHTSMLSTISGAGELQTALDGLSGERTLKVRIEAIDPSGVLALAGSAGASLGQSVRDNGGRVPGVDARIPQ